MINVYDFIKSINFDNDLILYYIEINDNFKNIKNQILSEYCNINDLTYINNFLNIQDQLCHLGSIVLQKYFVVLNQSNIIINKKDIIIKKKDIIIKKDRYQKPYIDNINFYYNISHDKNIVMGVFYNKPIGIDTMEDNKVTYERIESINHIFFESEKHINYITLWTILESYLKAIGTGFINFENRKFIIKQIINNNSFEIINGKENTILFKQLDINKKLYHVCITILN